MPEFQVGDRINETALGEFADLLREAYDNGARNNSTMEWNDVQAAFDKATDAFGDEGLAFQFAAEAGFEEEPKITFPTDASWETRAAAQLLFAYRYPDNVEWEDVDLAFEILLQANVERGVTPSR
ncbi:hypothetical protein G6L37_06040 [Agrobacterium rubi]|nr:hypothetical protein [Agrobacterium rubi]NTF24921.1 hypothetical protein [Agrobacterium rubi]